MSLQLHRMDAALSGRVFTVGYCLIPPYSEAVLHCTTCTVGGRSMASSGLLEGLTVFAENTGLVVGRTLVDPSGWRIPVLVSNFGQRPLWWNRFLRLVVPTLGLGRPAYWNEVTPILKKWCSVNDARCPECARTIRVNMSRHIRLAHTVCQCFWRCPVPTCPMWFVSELNGKDHLERIHNFTEGRCYSLYDCLRQFGLEWFGRRSFFDQREEIGQALWMDLAMARRSGQEFHNSYVLTTSPAFGNLRKFFCAAVREIQLAYDAFPGVSVAPAAHPSICDLMRQDIADSPQGAMQSYSRGSSGGHSGGRVSVATNRLVCKTFPSRRHAG